MRIKLSPLCGGLRDAVDFDHIGGFHGIERDTSCDDDQVLAFDDT